MKALLTATAIAITSSCAPAQAFAYEDTTNVRQYCENVSHYVERRAERIADARQRGYNGMEAARMYAFSNTLGDTPSYNGWSPRREMTDFLQTITIKIYMQPEGTNWFSFVRRIGDVTFEGCMEGVGS